MAVGVQELLKMLFDMIDEAKSVPLSGDKCMVERDRALQLIEDIQAKFPMELEEAEKLVANRNEYISMTRQEAERIKRQAENEVQRMMSEENIFLQAKQRAIEMMRQAEQRSNEVMRQAEERSRELKRSANEYCEDALRRTEEAVAEAYDEIKKSRARFRAAAGGTSGGYSGRMAYDVSMEEG